MMRRIPFLVPVVVLGLFAGSLPVLRAQETIATDRPGLALSPITVPRAALQFEIGLPQIALADGGSVEATTISVPVLALRYGISEWIEIRAASPLYNRIAGLAFLVTPALQLDTFFDRGLNDDATDWIFGVGVSARL